VLWIQIRIQRIRDQDYRSADPDPKKIFTDAQNCRLDYEISLKCKFTKTHSLFFFWQASVSGFEPKELAVAKRRSTKYVQ